MFNACFAYSRIARSVKVETSPQGGVVWYKDVANVVFVVCVVASKRGPAAVIGTVKKAAASTPSEFVCVSKLFRNVAVCNGYINRWRWGFTE
jgi:hypothetical protein